MIKRRLIGIVSTLATFLFLGSVALRPQGILDLGDDPNRIEVAEIRQITTDGGYSLTESQWSPDGKYFTALKGRDLWIFDKDGRFVRRFENKWISNWSPDSQGFLFGMILVNVETGASRRTVEGRGYNPAFLPSGDKVIFNSREGLSIVDIKTGALQTILADRERYFGSLFYVSAEKIFYVKHEWKASIEPHLYQYDSLTRIETKLWPETIHSAEYFLTPEGKVIIKAGFDRATDCFLYIDDRGEVVGRIPRVLDGVYKDNVRRGCSPNGKLVLVEAIEETSDGCRIKTDLFLVTLDGKKSRRLTSSDGVHEEDAIWSPKGDRIVFDDQDSENICVLTLRRK